MKLLIDIEVPGLEHLHLYEPEVPSEIAAFVSKLVRFRTRGPEPTVSVLVISQDTVLVDAESLIRLQQKAGAK